MYPQAHEILLVLREKLRTLETLQQKLFEGYEKTDNAYHKSMIVDELQNVANQIEFIKGQISEITLIH